MLSLERGGLSLQEEREDAKSPRHPPGQDRRQALTAADWPGNSSSGFVFQEAAVTGDSVYIPWTRGCGFSIGP